MTEDRPTRPLLIELDDDAPADPTLAPPVPEAPGESQAMLVAGRLARASPLLKAVLWAFGALFSFTLAVATHDFIAGLLARNPLLGSIALGLTAIAVALGAALAAREWLAYLRLSRLDGLRVRAGAVREAADLGAARVLTASLAALYRHRPEAAPALAVLAARREDVLDADALL
ncbi:MAG: TIGR01620 family protein, partial [Gemmobacter sp.]|nr:TIGR01620 family protein [Gemmobacter sp.]